ncbi:MAG: RNA 2',3'-cyclic phosphodiesterase [Candidatus Bipolaricaulis sp.]|nr:RNA 2',3'-cyclic phosphodiesterase [Candidatus Bipolaricaulis sp.]
MRAFFSLPIDGALRMHVGRVAERIRRETTMPASWVRPDNYHVTLRFLGEIDPDLTGALETAAGGVARGFAPFTLRVAELGAFPSIDRARVLWVGATADPAFGNLAGALERELHELGFAPERPETVAHITMVRIKGRPDARLPRVVEALGPFPPHSLRVDRLVLMESRLTPHGPTYDSLFSVPLRTET